MSLFPALSGAWNASCKYLPRLRDTPQAGSFLLIIQIWRAFFGETREQGLFADQRKLFGRTHIHVDFCANKNYDRTPVQPNKKRNRSGEDSVHRV